MRASPRRTDATGAQIRGKPLAFACALGKLQAAAERIALPVSPTMAPLAQGNRLSALRVGIASLF